MSTNLPDKLFHFMSAESALQMLQDKALYGTTARELDGVLELNADSTLQFSKPELTEAVVKAACGMIFGAEAPKGQSALIAAVQRWRQAERFSNEDEAKTVLQGLCEKMVDQAFVNIDSGLKQWQDFCARLAIWRLHEKIDNFYLWQNQADNFSGVAIRLTVDTSDALFKHLKPVQYANARPEISSVREQVESIIRSKSVNVLHEAEEKFLLKAPCYQREKEWRCFNHLDQASESAPRLPIDEHILKALYLGPMTSPELKEHILSLAKTNFPTLKTAQLQFAPGRFELTL